MVLVPGADAVDLANEAAVAVVVEHQEGAVGLATAEDEAEDEVAAVAAAAVSQEVDAAEVVVLADADEEATKCDAPRQSSCQLEWRQRTIIRGSRLPVDSTSSLQWRFGVTRGPLQMSHLRRHIKAFGSGAKMIAAYRIEDHHDYSRRVQPSDCDSFLDICAVAFCGELDHIIP